MIGWPMDHSWYVGCIGNQVSGGDPTSTIIGPRISSMLPPENYGVASTFELV